MRNLWRTMMHTTHSEFQSRMAMVLIIVLGLGISIASPAGAQPSAAPADTEVSQAQIQDLIRLLEDQQARTEFLQRLNALDQLQAETATTGSRVDLEVLSRASRGMELAIQQTLAASREVLSWPMQAPQRARELWTALSNPETYPFSLRTVRHLVISLAPALLIRHYPE